MSYVDHLGDWDEFALIVIGSYVLSFQVYLALPLQARAVAGSEAAGTVLVTVLFAVSGAVAVAGQLRVTAWLERRCDPGRCLVVGMGVLAAAFLPPLLAVGTAAVFPFEMDMIVRMSGDRLVATHYGFYNTVVGVGILLGNLFTGTVFDLARDAGWPWLPWAGLALLGAGCTVALYRLPRMERYPVG